MDKRNLWTPGILGFIVLSAEILLRYERNGQRWHFVNYFLITVPVVAIFCMGALIKGVRGLRHRQGEGIDARPGLLRWIDMFFGFVGVCIIFSFLGIEVHVLDTIVRIAVIAFFLVLSGAGYFVLSKWRNYDSGERAGLGFALILVLGIFFALASIASDPSTDGVFSSADYMVNDLSNIAQAAYQYRIKPKSMKGGNGSYVGFMIPSKMASNPISHYMFKVVSADTVAFKGVTLDGNSSVIVRIDGEGKFIPNSWKFTGERQTTEPFIEHE